MAGNGRQSGKAPGMKYKYVSSASEPTPSGQKISSYGVQFVWRPCKEHLQGGGSIWGGRGPLNADRSGLAQSAVVDDEDDEDIITPLHEDDDLADDLDDLHWRNIFVTCNAHLVRMYEAVRGQKPLLLQKYIDADDQEQFYCVGWTYNANGNHEWWALAAGKKGILRVVNAQNGTLQCSLTGHGEAINDLKTHPRDPSLVLTASKDESLRLWNLRSQTTVAVFAGLKGHRGEVVHTDFYHDGSKFASCGIDNSVRVWELYDDDKVVDAIKESHKVADLQNKGTYVYLDETKTRQKIKVPIRQFPTFVTRKVHKHYVDCVMWVHNLLLSKSVHNRMFLWEPEPDRESLSSPSSNFTLLEEYVLDLGNIWFVRFGLDHSRRLAACGNDRGVVSIFNLEEVPAGEPCRVQPNERTRHTPHFVRQCAFSFDGSILLTVDDNATVVQYERV